MEHAANLDQIEAAPNRVELEDVSLRIVDIVEAESACPARGITEAGAADTNPRDG